MAETSGSCHQKFDKLRTLLAENVASGNELGASICVNIDGETVVDLWSGFTDKERSHKWQKDTIVNVWSISKTITSLAALMLIDRGILDPDEKVAKYWPEFAQNGKGDVKVRHLLSHSSGVPGWEQPITISEVCDLEISTARLASQGLWYEPGKVSGYNSLDMGHLVGELVRRTTGRSLKQFIAEEIAGPLGADFQLGAVEKDWPRISELIPPQPMRESFAIIDKKSVAFRTLTNPPPDALSALTKEWRLADIGAANGHGNARSVARILSIISQGGELDGTRFLSTKTINLIFQEQTNGIDLVIGFPVRFGIGYGLPKKETATWIPEGRKCFWGGWGGSIAIMDLDNKMTICYTMNKMSGGTLGNANTEQYIRAIYEIVEGPKPLL